MINVNTRPKVFVGKTTHQANKKIEWYISLSNAEY